eukprot:211420_1
MLLILTLLSWRSAKALNINQHDQWVTWMNKPPVDGSVSDATWITWMNKPPADIPFEKSTDILGWDYLNNTNYQYGGADTWYPSWSADGKMYTSFTDGSVVVDNNDINITIHSGSGSGGNNWNSTTGYVTVIGDSPSSLKLINGGTFVSSTYPYRGRYPCGQLMYNNTWFYGTYLLNATDNNNDACGNWCEQGPFVGFRWSTDFGISWTEPRMNLPNNINTDNYNIFNENNNGQKVKFGAPHVVDFGQELKYSPDGKFYIIGHGANLTTSHQAWMQGDQVYMARNIPTIKNVNDSSTWEFYSGTGKWTTGDVYKAQPLFTWLNRTGVVTMTYFHVLKKYIMVISTPTFSPSMVKQFDTYFLESDNISGPWKYIVYMSEFGPEGYFVHYPSKFLSGAMNGSYYEMFLSYSANFAFKSEPAVPPGSGYHWSLQKSRFKLSSNFVEKLNAHK